MNSRPKTNNTSSRQTNKAMVILFYLSISILLLLLFSSPTLATTPSGTIQRTAKQQILTSIPPAATENTQPFLTSPSGKYTAYLLRRETSPTAGGFGNDFCYVQVQDTESGTSLWESECAPVSSANTCALVFDENGLDVFDGSNPAWDTGADNHNLERLELVDDGDMRIIDRDGELAWKASDDPRANQGCGLPGSPGLAPESPPFAGPLGGGSGGSLPFGQGVNNNQQEAEPSVDNTAFYSGCADEETSWFWMGVLVLVSGLFF